MGMMKAPPVPPPVRREPSSERPATSPEVEKDEPKPTPLPGLASTVETPSSPENSSAGLAPLPAMPKRAAPPRRKPQKSTSSGAAPAVVAASPVADASEETGHGHPVPPNPAEVPQEKAEEALEKEKVEEKVGAGEQGAEGAANAGIALAPVEEPKQEVSVGADVPTTEAAQAELTKVEPDVEHKEKELAVIVDEPDSVPLVASPKEELPPASSAGAMNIPDPAAGHHHRRISIPIPERDASYHETDLEFREFRKEDIGRSIHLDHSEDEPASRTTATMGEVEIEDEDDQDATKEEPSAPVERKRSLPSVPVQEEEVQGTAPLS